MINHLLVVDDACVSFGSKSKHVIVVPRGYLVVNQVVTIRVSGIDMANVEPSPISLCNIEKVFHLVEDRRVVIEVLNNHIDCSIREGLKPIHTRLNNKSVHVN